MQYNAPDTIYYKQVRNLVFCLTSAVPCAIPFPLLFPFWKQFIKLMTNHFGKARSIQELAKKKFEKIRLGIERSEELKSEQKTKLSSVVKKLIRKPISQTLQDPGRSDFSSGAALATPVDFQNGSSATQAGGSDRASCVDRLVEAPPLVDNNADKAEESFPGIQSASLFCMF